MVLSKARGIGASASADNWTRRADRALGRDWRTAYLFAAPMMILLVGLIGWPIVSAFTMSFFNVKGITWGPFVGMNNYIDQWTDPIFQDSLGITIRYTIASVTIKFIFGMCAALVLHNITRGKMILTPLMLLPFIVPEVVTALVWRFLFDPVFGGLNASLTALYGVTGGMIGSQKGISWTGTDFMAQVSMIIVNVWKGAPFFTLLALAGLKSIDVEQYDAASVDGANAWQRFLHITLPGLRYVIIVETLLSTIATFNAFGLIYLITQGGPGGSTRVYSILAYEKIGSLNYSGGVSVALTMAPFLLVAIIVLGRYMRAGQKGDFAGDDGVVWRAFMFVLWPIRMIVRALVWIFWRVNNTLEIAASAVSKSIYAVFTRGDVSRQPMARRASRRAGEFFKWSGLVLLLLFELFPFYWVFITGFKTTDQIRAFRDIFWPSPWTLMNFQKLLFELSFPLWLWNTVQVAVVSAIIGVLASSLGAYALVRLRWKGAGTISSTVLITYLMPGIMLVVPLYQIFATLKLTNTLASLMIAYPTFLLPFASWLMMGYYRTIPEELEDAAMIDGCNRFQAFFRVILPLVTPALLAVAMFSVTQAWNEFLLAFVFISKDSATTLPIGLGRMVIGDIMPWGLMMGASFLMAIPVMILYSIGNRYMVGGLTSGSVKG